MWEWSVIPQPCHYYEHNTQRAISHVTQLCTQKKKTNGIEWDFWDTSRGIWNDVNWREVILRAHPLIKSPGNAATEMSYAFLTFRILHPNFNPFTPLDNNFHSQSHNKYKTVPISRCCFSIFIHRLIYFFPLILVLDASVCHRTRPVFSHSLNPPPEQCAKLWETRGNILSPTFSQYVNFSKWGLSRFILSNMHEVLPLYLEEFTQT